MGLGPSRVGTTKDPVKSAGCGSWMGPELRLSAWAAHQSPRSPADSCRPVTRPGQPHQFEGCGPDGLACEVPHVSLMCSQDETQPPRAKERTSWGKGSPPTGQMPGPPSCDRASWGSAGGQGGRRRCVVSRHQDKANLSKFIRALFI